MATAVKASLSLQEPFCEWMIHLVQNQSTVHWKEPAQKNNSNQNLHNGTMGCGEAHEHKSRKQNEIHNEKLRRS